MTALARLRREDTLLLVVDVQERILPLMFEAERVVRNCALLVTAARQLQIPVVVTEQYPERLGLTVEPLRAALGEFVPHPKLRFSAWGGLARTEIEESGRRTVLLCGIESHICVLQTALDLLETGHSVFVAGDAVSARQLSNRNVGSERARGAGALPTSAESAIFELLGEAGTQDFRALQPLMR